MASTTTDRLAGVTAGLASKAPVRMASTGNLTLSGLQTVDGVAGAADDRILVKDNTDATENGVYDMKSGAWVRSLDFDGARDVVSGTFVVVTSGSAAGGTAWRISTADPITIGTTSIAFAAAVWSSASGTEVIATGTSASISLADRFAQTFNANNEGASTSASAAVNDAAFQSAIDKAEAVVVAGGVGVVTANPGKYDFNSLTIDQAITFFGFGGWRNPSIILMKQTDVVGVTITANAVHVTGVSVDGTDSPQSSATAYGWHIQGKSECHIQAINNGGHGIFMEASTGKNLNFSVLEALANGNNQSGVRVEDTNDPTAPNVNMMTFRVSCFSNGLHGFHMLTGFNNTGVILTESNTGKGLYIEQSGTDVNRSHEFYSFSESNAGNNVEVTSGATDITLHVADKTNVVTTDGSRVLIKKAFGGLQVDGAGATGIKQVEYYRNENANEDNTKGVRLIAVGSSSFVMGQIDFIGTGRIVITTDPAAARSLGTGDFQFGPGLMVGSPTGGDKGAGTINVPTVYVNNIPIFSGSATPEAAVTAPIGSLFLRTDGGAGTTLYVKESGTGNTGWSAVS